MLVDMQNCQRSVVPELLEEHMTYAELQFIHAAGKRQTRQTEMAFLFPKNVF